MAHMAHVCVRPGSCVPCALVAAATLPTWHTVAGRRSGGGRAAVGWRSAGGRLAVEAGEGGPAGRGHGYGASADNFFANNF